MYHIHELRAPVGVLVEYGLCVLLRGNAENKIKYANRVDVVV